MIYAWYMVGRNVDTEKLSTKIQFAGDLVSKNSSNTKEIWWDKPDVR